MKKVVGTTATVFVYDASGQLVAEYSNEQAQGSGTSYVTADTLSSTRVVTNASGEVKARYDYLPFGFSHSKNHVELLQGAGESSNSITRR